MIKEMIAASFFLAAPLSSVASISCEMKVGGLDEGVCPVSIYTLITNGEAYNGKLVMVTGFYAFADTPILFSDKDMFTASSVSDGLSVTLPKNKRLAAALYDFNHLYIALVARFDVRGTDTSKYYGFHTSGRLYDIKLVSRADRPWGYVEPAQDE